MHILLIGCGNIGLRHLQSILTMQNNKTISIVDPSKSSLQKAADLNSDSVNTINKINLYTSINEINNMHEVDIALIATSASVRANIIKELFCKTTPKHLILEKLLFTRTDDLKFFYDFFKSFKTKVWVNQWLDSEISHISKLLPKNKKFNLEISGKQWGLCCNSVHFIEWFHSLTSRQSIEVKEHQFSKIIEAKRPGFYEILGSITLESNSGNSLRLLSLEGFDPKESINIKISWMNSQISCVWTDDNLIGYLKNDNELKKPIKEKIKYQSQRTHQVIYDLISKNYCSLPNYELSYKHHLLFYPLFDEFFKNNGFNLDHGIPIT